MKDEPPPRERAPIRVFRELLRAHAAITAQARDHVHEQSGLSMSEFDMIAELGNQGGVRMSDLAAKMVVSPANATRVAQALAAKGLVVRQRAERSEREVLARLTPEGDAMFRRHFPAAVAFMSDLVDRRLTRDEQITLADLLEKLAAR